jgi:signal transduction histidine kinase
LNVGENEKQILGVATNISERKKAEAEKVKLVESLMQNIQDLEQFTYMVSHNLRSHVARILGLTYLLDKENKDNEFNDYIFTTVTDEATRLDEIITDLNMILTVRNNNDEKRETINLSEICESVLLSLQNDLDKCGGGLIKEIPTDMNIYAIKTYVYSIILNLLSNAIKYRSPERLLNILLQVEYSSDKQFICLSVKDNGLGINLVQNKDKVFGLYRRFHSHVEGKGIGLHITKTQIERMGGKIEIDSELDKGTLFKVYFPHKI